jgi:type I restriction-modification system DNA methylase subunit
MARKVEKKSEALLVQRFINEVLITQLSIPLKQIVNDTTFCNYTNSKRPDLLISEEEYKSNNDSDKFIKNLVAYAEVKDNCSVNDKDWKDGIKQGKEKAAKLNLPFFIVTNCKVSIFYNTSNLKEISLNTNPIREFQTIDIFRLIKNRLRKDKNCTNIITNVDSVSVISEAIFNKKLWELKTIYRDIDFGEGGKDKIDFTIGFVTLEYFEEKERSERRWRENKIYWSSCRDENSKKLTSNLKGYIDEILKNEESFKKFQDLINKVKQYIEKITEDQVKSIYEVIDSMKPLHGCGFDLFGAVYESFANKKEKEEFGEFFTRRHYAHIFAKLLLKDRASFIENQKFTILDPACGTGGFLTEAFKVLQNNYLKSSTYSEKAKKFLSDECFYGIDIKGENGLRAKLNMFLVGDGHTNIMGDSNSLISRVQPNKNGNLQSNLDKILNKEYNYIITNPPYGNGTTKAEIKSANNKRKEIAFLFKIIKLLAIGGKACVVLPDGVLENPSYAKIREEFLGMCKISYIISLPKFAFAPYTKEKTYAVFFEKRSKEITKIQNDDVWMYIIDNDGLANSDKRFQTKLRNNKNGWMHDEISGWVSTEGEEMTGVLEKRFEKKWNDESTGGTEWISDKGEKLRMRKGGFVSIEDIRNNRFNLLSEVYLRNEINTKIRKGEKFKASEVFDCISGNQGIYEEFIYQHLQVEGNQYKVLSSSLNEQTEMGYIRLSKAEEEQYNLFCNSYGIHVARLGKGGSMKFLEQDSYITTDKAYILYLKEDFKKQINISTKQQEKNFLVWFIGEYQDLLYDYAPKTDNAAWNKTNFFKEAEFFIPKIPEIRV